MLNVREMEGRFMKWMMADHTRFDLRPSTDCKATATLHGGAAVVGRDVNV